MSVTLKTNLPDFRRQMQAVGKAFIPIATGAARAAASEFAKAVRRQAPRGKTRRLSKAVVIKRARRNVPRGTAHYIVGIRQGKSQQNIRRKRKGKAVSVNLDAFYWFFLEAGWTPRKSRLQGGRRLRALRLKRERAAGAKVVRHKFIEPAFQSANGRALIAFYGKLNDGVAKLSP